MRAETLTIAVSGTAIKVRGRIDEETFREMAPLLGGLLRSTAKLWRQRRGHVRRARLRTASSVADRWALGEPSKLLALPVRRHAICEFADEKMCNEANPVPGVDRVGGENGARTIDTARLGEIYVVGVDAEKSFREKWRGLDLPVSTSIDQLKWATELLRPLWRVALEEVIKSRIMHMDGTGLGAGTVRTASEVFDCVSDGRFQIGLCGPTLVVLDELHPPLLRAIATPGWRFDHREASIRSPYGFVHRRRGPMPDGAFYIDGFGYIDTGERETVRAIFYSLSLQ